MKVLRSLLVVMSAFAVVSCGSSGSDGFFDQFSLQGTNEAMADIAGNWDATLANFSSSAIGPVVSVEIIGLGGTASLSIQSDGRFSFTTQLPGESPNVVTGQLAFDADLLIVADDADPGEWEFYGIQFNGSTMTLSGPSEYDFDDDGSADPAILTLTLQRV